MSNVFAPPALATPCSDGEKLRLQPLSCVTVKVWPETLMVPERAGPELPWMKYPTAPLPLPLAPEVTVIHGALLDAAHPQPPAAVTATLPNAPDAATFALVGLSVSPLQSAACETKKFSVVPAAPAMVIVPLRCAPVLASAVKATVPLPLPLAPESTVIQGTLPVAVQPQVPVEVTWNELIPPPAATEMLSGEIDRAHEASAQGENSVTPHNSTQWALRSLKVAP